VGASSQPSGISKSRSHRRRRAFVGIVWPFSHRDTALSATPNRSATPTLSRALARLSQRIASGNPSVVVVIVCKYWHLRSRLRLRNMASSGCTNGFRKDDR
jgi:hypothetical protein